MDGSTTLKRDPSTARRWPQRLLVLTAVPVAVGVLAATAASSGPETRRLSSQAVLGAGAPTSAQPGTVTVRTNQVRAPVVVQLAPKTPKQPAPGLPVSPRVPASRTVRRTPAAVPSTTTPQQRLAAAVARIPRYRAGEATWVLTDQYGSWGTADWYTARVYVSPSVPANRIFDVVTHEWSHLLTVQVYGGNVDAAVTAMNRWFGGSNLDGAERAADCMARQLGAAWTHYSNCQDPHWQQGAQILLARRQLPRTSPGG